MSGTTEAPAGTRTVWITGGGTGMGRASALAAAREGWVVAVSGRRPEPLDEVVRAVAGAGGSAVAVPVDATRPAGLEQARDLVLERCGRIDALVLAAGLNVPRRSWADQDLEELDAVVATNLTSLARTVALALPELRRRSGSVVVVSSYAGWRFSPAAGVAYSASKSALASLTQTLNAQEAGSGVRACHLCPGDVDTDFLQHRPAVPDAAARAVMLTPDDVARAVVFVLGSPAHVRVDELVISPLAQA